MKTQLRAPVADFGQNLFLRNLFLRSLGSSDNRLVSLLGIQVVYDLSRKPGDRVVKLDVLCTQCRVPSYEPLQMGKTYKVVLPSFLANGGDGFRMIKDEALRHDSGKHNLPPPTPKVLTNNSTGPERGATHDARTAKPEQDPAPVLPARPSFVGKQQHSTGEDVPCPSPAHRPTRPSPKCFKTLLSTYKRLFRL